MHRFQKEVSPGIVHLRLNLIYSVRTRGRSKVVMTTPIDKLRLHTPASVIEMLKATQYYVSSSDSIVIQSDEYRKQSENRNDCFKRLREVCLKVGEDAVKRERSKGPPKTPSVMR